MEMTRSRCSKNFCSFSFEGRQRASGLDQSSQFHLHAQLSLLVAKSTSPPGHGFLVPRCRQCKTDTVPENPPVPGSQRCTGCLPRRSLRRESLSEGLSREPASAGL